MRRLKFLNISKEEANVPDIFIADYYGFDDNSKDLSQAAPPTPLSKLKIRNTIKYLNWRLSILKRDNFTCKICHVSVKENKSLRLEIHTLKALMISVQKTTFLL
jgi:hypothetical protein